MSVDVNKEVHKERTVSELSLFNKEKYMKHAKLRNFRLVLFVLCLFASLLIMPMVWSTAEATVVVSNEGRELVEQNFATYKSNSKYNGTKIASHIGADEFANFEVTNSGGTHQDGNNESVFSNFVIFKISLLFDHQTKFIGNSGVKVSKDKCDWNDMDKANGYAYGNKDTDTEQYIAYGAVSAIRKNGDGSVTKYTPMFSKGNTEISEQIFNMDGDYTVYVFFQTVKGREYQKHILSWSFKIRTKIYLLDQETNCMIKDSGISAKNVIVDYADRNKVYDDTDAKLIVECKRNGMDVDIQNGYVLTAKPGVSDKYEFVVRANEFVAEKFKFVVDTKNIQEQILFGNLRKQIGQFSYEAEEHFFIIWTQVENNPIAVDVTYTDIFAPVSDGKAPKITTEYQSGTMLDKVGHYYIHAQSKTMDVKYWINVVEGDAPSYNYGVLSAKRFNNFKTKWYEVYDRINDKYMCFDIAEYQRAYNAAMTVENCTVDDATGGLFYNGRWYKDRIELTSAMNDFVFSQNLKTVYFDPDDFSDENESLRTFSSAAFDGTIYLNDEFQFVKSHSAEVNTVMAISEDGTEYPIEFFKPISEQNIPHGAYTIKEIDKYGHVTSYTVYRDKRAPEVSVVANGQLIHAENNTHIQIDGSFQIESVVDDSDPFAVIKVVVPDGTIRYYYQNEYKGIVFSIRGDYTVSAYDRNNNAIVFTIAVA